MIGGADAHAGALGDLRHGGGIDSLLGMQPPRRLNQAASRLLGRFRTPFQPVAPGRHGASYIRRIIFIEYYSTSVKPLPCCCRRFANVLR
jgi:hypothetical protein